MPLLKSPINNTPSTSKPTKHTLLYNIAKISGISTITLSCIFALNHYSNVMHQRPRFIEAKFDSDIENTYFVNPKAVRWIHKSKNNCYQLCAKQSGCSINKVFNNTFDVCPGTKSYSYIEKVLQ